MKRILGNGRYANVTSTLAIVLAMGGTSYAAVTVTGANIKDGSIKRKDLASKSVDSAKVKNGSLLRADFKSGQLHSGPEGARGVAGSPGARGVQGIQGVQGVQGVQGEPGSPATRLFAVVPANSPTLLAQSGVFSFTHNGLGSYTIVFDQAIGDCAWIATPGARNGATNSIDNRIVTVNGNPVTDTIQVRTGLSGAAQDMTFNIAVLC